MNGDIGTKLLNGGAIGAAIAASVCCFGPLALALFGLGGGALLLKFASCRPYFLGLSTLFLGGAFYLTYRRSAAEKCEPVSACASPATRRGQKVAIWVATLIVALAAALPYYSKYLFR